MKLDLRILLVICVGGAIGSGSRYLLNTFIQSQTTGVFPLGTMVINVSGSALIGLLMQLSLQTTAITPELRLFLTTGFCGGFTTFSTFSYEAVMLLEGGELLSASWYVAGSVALSLLGTFLGFGLAKRIMAP